MDKHGRSKSVSTNGVATDHQTPARRPDLVIFNINKELAVSAENRVKIKEIEKRDKCLDLARELRKPWNMRVIMITILIGALGTVPKGLKRGLEELEIRGRIDTIHYWDRPEYWEESCRLEETCYLLNSSENSKHYGRWKLRWYQL